MLLPEGSRNSSAASADGPGSGLRQPGARSIGHKSHYLVTGVTVTRYRHRLRFAQVFRTGCSQRVDHRAVLCPFSGAPEAIRIFVEKNESWHM